MGHSRPGSADSSFGLVRITPTATESWAAEQCRFVPIADFGRMRQKAIRLTPDDQAKD
jgi:hypothetical protein